jgi:hypothetical protein
VPAFLLILTSSRESRRRALPATRPETSESWNRWEWATRISPTPRSWPSGGG